jgi:hypothetical protein
MESKNLSGFVVTIKLLLTAALLAGVSYTQDKTGVPSLDVSKSDGGSVVIELGSNISINKESSLHRTWYVISDPACPVRMVTGLSAAGINIKYRGERGFWFTSDGLASARTDVSAFELSAVLFDLWGDHLKTLSLVALQDLRSGSTISLSDKFEWYASDQDTTGYLTCVTYVRTVRLMDGKLWRADMRPILRKLGEIQLKASEEKLDARPLQDKK